MSNVPPPIVVQRVSEELRHGGPVDIYRVATKLQGDCPDLAFEEIVRMVAELVINAGGNAVWNRHTS